MDFTLGGLVDGVSLIFYAVVCGVLSLLAPWMGGLLVRFLAGAAVGVGAAAVLPYLQGAMAY